MSEFEEQGPFPEKDDKAPSEDILTLPFEGNPWLETDKDTYQTTLHTKDGKGTVESGYLAILQLAQEQGKDPEEAVATIVSSLRSEWEEGLAQLGKVDDATFDRLSDSYGKRLGLFLGNELIRVLPGARQTESPSLVEIDWKSMFGKGKPAIFKREIQPDENITFRDASNKRVAQATRQAIERMEKELGIASRYQDGESRSADDNMWYLNLPKVKEKVFSLNRELYSPHMEGGYRAISTFRPRELGLGDELLPDKYDMELPNPKIAAECKRVYDEEIQKIKKGSGQ